MTRLITLLFVICPVLPAAQQRDSYFDDYTSYSAFVDENIISRNFITLIQVLGGRDEYTEAELNGVNNQFLSIYPNDFASGVLIRETDLGSGFRQEARVYWSDAGDYVFFFAMLHDRADAIVVLTFSLNSDVSKIMAEF